MKQAIVKPESNLLVVTAGGKDYFKTQWEIVPNAYVEELESNPHLLLEEVPEREPDESQEGELEPVSSEFTAEELNELQKKDLQDLLTESGIEYDYRATKNELIALVLKGN